MTPGEFLIIWADDETNEGIFHSTIKLSKDGEEIGIFNEAGIAIDQYIFGPQTTDISEGRFHDAEDNWIFFEEPTPGESNLFTDIEVIQFDNELKIYPNPAIADMVYLNKITSLSVFNTQGQKVGEYNQTRSLDISKLPQGLYLFVTETGKKAKLIIQ
jgi:hypothetical protein